MLACILIEIKPGSNDVAYLDGRWDRHSWCGWVYIRGADMLEV
jgi:hypothetical protein